MYTDSNVVVTRRKGFGVGGEGDLIYSDGIWFDFRWWAYSVIYRCSIEMYT